MSNIIKAIQKINPTAEVSVSGDDINTIVWENGTTPISKEDIEAQFPAVELEMAMADLRQKRNALLSATDYLALSDNTMSDDVKVYRQALRDIGVTTKEQVEAVEFPTKPQGII
jgi:hypothetical protein